MAINLEQLVKQNNIDFDFAGNRFLRKIFLSILKKVLYINRINNFLKKHSFLSALQFIDEIFDEINFTYVISSKDIQKIPSEGRVICVANHPIGSLDSLALLKTFLEIRRDVKIVANDLLCSLEKLNDYLIPVKLDYNSAQRKTIQEIGNALNEEKAVIMFPAASVSRLKGFSITDSKWNKGAIYFAKKFNSPILPVFIQARNSLLFYIISVINKRISTALLPHELFNKKNTTIKLSVGDIIPAKAFTDSMIEEAHQVKLLKKHVLLIGKNKKGVFTTERNVIHPCDKKIIRKELNNSQMLGTTHDNLKIFITTKLDSPETLNEIARLREVTFRKVGEGTGKKFDLDKFDEHYNHLIVWDENELEIVGAYRVGSGNDIINKHGVEGFYTSTLFNYSENLVNNYLPSSIELGRSFVQKKYWNTNALNYLWQGIGAYLKHNPSVKYMFGGVSISKNYPLSIQEQIVYYFSKWFGCSEVLAESKKKFIISERSLYELNKLFSGSDLKEDYKILKNMIKPAGYTVPVLYKHYSDLCESGGVKFLDFGIDPDFENCIDGLILVDVNMIRKEKKQKFMNQKLSEDLRASA